ncbi:MAG: DUF1573 domain-containing protein [Vicingus serpentipes]|nr:DUF1573 domain-containing protein [Vicingus serpentipes]
MKKILLPLAVVGILCSCGNTEPSSEISTDLIKNPSTASTEKVDEADLPFFEFDEELKEFGTITQGESVSLSFRFKNVGKSDLIISSAQGSCGCTVPQWPKEPVQPGKEGVIEVTFNSTGKQGMQNKTVTLVANTIPNTKVLAIKGEVLAPKTNK